MGDYLRFHKASTQPRTVARGKDGARLYAIGDVHGCFDELVQLLDQIRLDNEARPPADCFVVFLGDLVDRGPHSRQVIEYLRSEPLDFAKIFYLKGNHEEIIVRAFRGEPELLPYWLRYGGYEFLQSYGIEPHELMALDVEALEYMATSRVPLAHIDFLAQGHDSIKFGDYLLVHAGIRPGVALEAQSSRDLRWIRDGFLNSDRDHGFIVVHGHTISDGVDDKINRIGVDTGAYKTGILSAVCIDGENRDFLSVGSQDLIADDQQRDE